jgi:hypothetical protein
LDRREANGTIMEPMATRTLAEIYLRQGHLREAYHIFKALSERDPLDQELRERLREVGSRLGLPVSPGQEEPSPILSQEERIRTLEGWLANIQERRRK